MAAMMKRPQQVEVIMTHSSISSTEQLNFHTKFFCNSLLTMKIMKIICYKNLALYGSYHVGLAGYNCNL